MAKTETWWCIKDPDGSLEPWSSSLTRKECVRYITADPTVPNPRTWGALRRRGYRAVRVTVEEKRDGEGGSGG